MASSRGRVAHVRCGQRDPCIILQDPITYARNGDDLCGAQRLIVMAVDFGRWSQRTSAGVASPCGWHAELRQLQSLQSDLDATDRQRLAAALSRLGLPGSWRKRVREDRGECETPRQFSYSCAHLVRACAPVRVSPVSVRVALAAAALCADRSASPATVLSREDEQHRLDTIQWALRLHAHTRAVLVDYAGPLASGSDWFLSPPQVQAVMGAFGSVVGGGGDTSPTASSPAPMSSQRPVVQPFQQGERTSERTDRTAGSAGDTAPPQPGRIAARARSRRTWQALPVTAVTASQGRTFQRGVTTPTSR